MVQQKKEQASEAEGRSRGGLSTKIHAAVDALGNPVRFIFPPRNFLFSPEPVRAIAI